MGKEIVDGSGVPGKGKTQPSHVGKLDDDQGPTEDIRYTDNFCLFKPGPNYYLEYGITEDFPDLWFKIRNASVYLSLRQSLFEFRRPRFGDHVSKSIQFHIKTQTGPPYKGHLRIPDDWTLDSSKPITPKELVDSAKKYEHLSNEYVDVHGVKQNVYVTYERQDLRFIETMIRAKEYEVVDVGLQGSVPYLVFRCINDKGKYQNYMVMLNEFDDSSTAQIPRAINITAAYGGSDRLTRQKSFSAIPADGAAGQADVELSSQELKRRLDLLFGSSMWLENSHKTVRILECTKMSDSEIANRTETEEKEADHDEKIVGKWEVDLRPNIACDERGIPVKGDIDQRNCIISSQFPLDHALALLDIECDPEIMINEALKSLGAFRGALFKLQADHEFLKLIDDAIKNLEAYYKKNKNSNNINMILINMGNIELVNAVVILAHPGIDIEHGSDGISPLPPEDYAVEHIIMDGDKVFDTYGEFDYLKCILMNEQFFSKNLVNFNTAAFVETRVDSPQSRKYKTVQTITIDNKRIDYNNGEDEQYSISLHRILYERQLLYLKKMGPDKLKEYVDIEKRNQIIKLRRAEKRGDMALVKLLIAGFDVKKKIIENVESYDNNQIERRLREIRGLYRDLHTQDLSPRQPKPPPNRSTSFGSQVLDPENSPSRPVTPMYEALSPSLSPGTSFRKSLRDTGNQMLKGRLKYTIEYKNIEAEKAAKEKNLRV